jgi:hypothetical protein
MTNRLADIYDQIAEGFASASLELRAIAEGAPSTSPDAPQAPLPPLTAFEDTPQGRSADGGCPAHGLPWVVRPAGTSKATGQPYNAFYHCNEQNDDGSFCRQKPSPAWVKAHPIR